MSGAAALLVLFGASAQAASDRRPIPAPLTMQEKVAASDVIVLAEAIHAFVTDAEGNPTIGADSERYPYQHANWLTLRVKRVLKNSAEVASHITVNSPTDGSALPDLRQKYLG